MRTDVKIGVAAGLLLVIAFVVYHAVFSEAGNGDANLPGTEVAAKEDPGGEEAANAGSRDGGADTARVVLPRFGGVSPRAVMPRMGTPEPANATPSVSPAVTPTPAPITPAVAVAPGIGETPISPERPVVPVVRETPPPAPPAPAVAVAPGIGETPARPERPVVPVIRETPTPSAAGAVRDVPGRPEPIVRPVIGSRTPPINPVTPGIGPVPAGPHRTYVVQKGDAGFWAIAQKVYGDGREWTLIAKANPGADSNALKPGQKLRIPPKPVARPAAAGGVSPAHGELLVSPGGERHYVVKKGDAGFWGIAQTLYGNGKYWTLIAKANPDVNSSGLKPGDKLLIPAKPAAVSTPVASAPAILPGPGRRIYVVRKSDTAGFWGIAAKAYGSGMYWRAIADANPSAKSASLRVGQRLILPELTDEMRRRVSGVATTRSTGAPTPAPGPKDVEDIGPRPRFR